MLQLEVRRSHLLEDTLAAVQSWQLQRSFLRRPLEVRFAGELGVDQGGLVKEFFQLVLPLIFKEVFFETKQHVWGWCF